MENKFENRHSDDPNSLTTDDREVLKKKILSSTDVKNALNEVSGAKFKLLGQDSVGPTVGIEIRRSAIIACLLIHLWTGGRPTLRSYEMICFYLSGWADLDEVTTHLKKLANSKKTN